MGGVLTATCCTNTAVDSWLGRVGSDARDRGQKGQITRAKKEGALTIRRLRFPTRLWMLACGFSGLPMSCAYRFGRERCWRRAGDVWGALGYGHNAPANAGQKPPAAADHVGNVLAAGPIARQIADKRRELGAIRGTPVPIIREVAADRRRTTRVLNKGNFLDPGDTVTAASPSAASRVTSTATPTRRSASIVSSRYVGLVGASRNRTSTPDCVVGATRSSADTNWLLSTST